MKEITIGYETFAFTLLDVLMTSRFLKYFLDMLILTLVSCIIDRHNFNFNFFKQFPIINCLTKCKLKHYIYGIYTVFL